MESFDGCGKSKTEKKNQALLDIVRNPSLTENNNTYNMWGAESAGKIILKMQCANLVEQSKQIHPKIVELTRDTYTNERGRVLVEQLFSFSHAVTHLNRYTNTFKVDEEQQFAGENNSKTKKKTMEIASKT